MQFLEEVQVFGRYLGRHLRRIGGLEEEEQVLEESRKFLERGIGLL